MDQNIDINSFTVEAGYTNRIYQSISSLTVDVAGSIVMSDRVSGVQGEIRFSNYSGDNSQVNCGGLFIGDYRILVVANTDTTYMDIDGNCEISTLASVTWDSSYDVHLTGTGNLDNGLYGNGFEGELVLEGTADITCTGNVRTFNKVTLENGADLDFASITWYLRGSGLLWEDQNTSDTIANTGADMRVEMTGDIELDFGNRAYDYLDLTLVSLTGSYEVKLNDDAHQFGAVQLEASSSALTCTLDPNLWIMEGESITMGAGYNSSKGIIDFTISNPGYGLVQAGTGGLLKATTGSGIKFHTTTPTTWHNMISVDGGDIDIPSGIIQTGEGILRISGWFATNNHDLSGCSVDTLDLFYANGSTQIFDTNWTHVENLEVNPDSTSDITFRFKNSQTYSIGNVVHNWGSGNGDWIVDTDSAGNQATWDLDNATTLTHMDVKDNNLITSTITVNDGTSTDSGNNSANWIFSSANVPGAVYNYRRRRI